MPMSQEAALRVGRRQYWSLLLHSPQISAPDSEAWMSAHGPEQRGRGTEFPHPGTLMSAHALLSSGSPAPGHVPLREAVPCFHPQEKAEKDKSDKEGRLLAAPMHVGVDGSISLKPGGQVRGGDLGQSPALIAAKDHWAAQVTPGGLLGPRA